MVEADPHDAPSMLYAVKRLELAIRAQLDDMLATSGVTTLQYTALTVLEHVDGISAAQLARKSFVTPQAMADMLRALEDRGLIRRSPNPDSKRERLVHLTDQGHALLRRFSGAADDIARRMTSRLTEAEVRAFRHALGTAWTTLGSSEVHAP